ncbi:MAG: gamma-glutamylcyclotransferase [Planctomycetes bacterium]|nr:gamma-glutamylcyclotransferase [Planctomycetota bacterium]
MELYFAYGSNLWTKQMRGRCPSTRVEGLATLRNHRLWFPLKSQRWGDGVASIRPDESARVEGVLYSISWGDLKAMDVFEGVPVNLYQRIEVPVLCDGEIRLAWTYMGRIEQGAPFPTTRAYIDTILRGAVDHGLDKDWIGFLRDFPVSD